MTNADIQEALRYGKRAVVALERIAKALETGVANDPLTALQAALGAGVESEGIRNPDGSRIQLHGVAPHPVDPNADMPPYIRAALGLD